MGMIALPHTTPAAMLCNTGYGPAFQGVIYTPLAQQGLTVSRYHILIAPTHPKTLQSRLSVCLCSMERQQPSTLIRPCNICFSLLANFLQNWEALVC